MNFITVECGTVELENLLTVSTENIAMVRWQVRLNYKDQKEPIKIKCKNTPQA